MSDLPNSLIVPTNDPAKTLAEYAPLGYRWEQVYVGKFNLKLAQGKNYAVALFRPMVKQPELI